LGPKKSEGQRETRFKRCLYSQQILDLMIPPLYWQVESARLLAQGTIKSVEEK